MGGLFLIFQRAGRAHANDCLRWQGQKHRKLLAATVALAMPRCVELLSGAYLDYYYHCTVIVVSWYAPYGDLRGGAFLWVSTLVSWSVVFLFFNVSRVAIQLEFLLGSPTGFFACLFSRRDAAARVAYTRTGTRTCENHP
jgi:hypothetical protein